MNISELIADLTALQRKHGDVPVRVVTDRGMDVHDVDGVEFNDDVIPEVDVLLGEAVD